MSLELRNAHSVLAALQARPADVEEVVLPQRPSGVWRTIASLATEAGVPTRLAPPPGERAGDPRSPRGRSDTGPKLGRVGAACAIVAERAPVAIETLLARPPATPTASGSRSTRSRTRATSARSSDRRRSSACAASCWASIAPRP